jgi:hypothetical protein
MEYSNDIITDNGRNAATPNTSRTHSMTDDDATRSTTATFSYLLPSEEKKDEHGDQFVVPASNVQVVNKGSNFDDSGTRVDQVYEDAAHPYFNDTNDETKDSAVWHDVPVHTADVGNCLPSAEEIYGTVYQENSKASKKSLWIKCCTTRMIVILVGIFLVVLFSIIFAKTKDKSAKDNGTTSFTRAYNQTMQFLVENNVSSQESLTTYGTPQYYATSFIANDLGLKVPQQNNKETNDQIYTYVSRYVLALNYYNFNNTPSSNTWKDRMNFTTSADVCQWNSDFFGISRMGVTCSSSRLPINLTLCMLIALLLV